ncbi:daf-9 [Pristionchus pacificus]|nr:daf-9 [Pristionchus pacificus]
MDSESPHNLSADPRIDSLEEDPGDPNREDPLLESGLPQPVAIPRMDSSQQVNTNRHRLANLVFTAIILIVFVLAISFVILLGVQSLVALLSFAIICELLKECAQNQIPIWYYPGMSPQGPLPLPIIGHLAMVNSREPQRTMIELSKRYKSKVLLMYLPQPVVVFTGYEELKIVSRMSKAQGRPTSYLWRIFMRDRIDGIGVILSSGWTWIKGRKFAIDHLRRRNVNNSGITRDIEEVAARMIGHIEHLMESNTSKSINLEQPVAFAVFYIIYDIVLGRKCTDINDHEVWQLKEKLDNILESVQSVAMVIVDRYPWMKWIMRADYKYRERGNALTQFFEREFAMNTKLFNGAHNDDINKNNLFFSYLRDPQQLENGCADIVTLAGEIWTGGMETTVTALRWAIIYLMKNPSIQERLHEEILQRYPPCSDSFDYATRAELPFLCATMEEVLRLSNVLPWNIPHRAIDDFSINGYEIKAGTQLMLSYSSLNQDEEHFPDPYRFNPDRFIRREASESEMIDWKRRGKDPNDFMAFQQESHLAPFGMGGRQCPGERLARVELFVFIITLVQRFRFSIDEANPPDLTRPRGMTSAPKKYVTMVHKRDTWYTHPSISNAYSSPFLSM